MSTRTVRATSTVEITETGVAATRRRMKASKTPIIVSERKRVSIPLTDTATLKWWSLQHDVATSLRLLILEEVAAHGYTDRLDRIAAAATSTAMPAAPTADPRDAEIARLLVELEDLRLKIGPLLPFLPGLVDDIVV